MVHQHFMLIPVMTVAENIVLATEPTRENGVLLDYARGRAARPRALGRASASPSTRRASSRTSPSASSSASRS